MMESLLCTAAIVNTLLADLLRWGIEKWFVTDKNIKKRFEHVNNMSVISLELNNSHIYIWGSIEKFTAWPRSPSQKFNV